MIELMNEERLDLKVAPRKSQRENTNTGSSIMHLTIKRHADLHMMEEWAIGFGGGQLS